MIKMQVRTLFVVFILSFAYGQDRKITSQLNPGCESCNKTLVYIQAEGHHDLVHQIWDFTRGKPTVIFAITGLNSTLKIIWEGQYPKEFLMQQQPLYSFGFVIESIYEYDDIDDVGYLREHVPKRVHSLDRLEWRINSNVLNSSSEAMLRVHSGIPERHTCRECIDIKLDLLPFNDYAVELPHLIHTANSTLVDVSLVNLTTTRSFNASRFALHFILVSTDERTDSMHYTMRKSLDDEHTPGIFEISEIKTPQSYRHGDGGFYQFRPVAYRQRVRGVASSTLAHVTDFNRTFLPKWSTLKSFYKGFDSNHLLIQDMFISFGEPGDGFYKQHNYTSWSFTVGYGLPPLEGFSFFVVMIISIGLGVPVVLALSGIIYVIVRRYKRRNSPTRFIDED